MKPRPVIYVPPVIAAQALGYDAPGQDNSRSSGATERLATPQPDAGVSSPDYRPAMGYWGYHVIAKGDHTLAEHPAVVAFGDEAMDDRPRGAWRELHMRRSDNEADIDILVAATNAPVMAIYIMDEDCAIAEGVTPTGLRWHGIFHEDLAREVYGAVPTDYQRADAVTGATAWAHEAGLTPIPAAIDQALAHYWLESLYDAVGLPDILYTE